MAAESSPQHEQALEESRDPEAARQLLDQGREAQRNLDRWGAIEAFEQAFEHAPEDQEVCFHLAYQLDLVGEESEALHLYEQACAVDRPKVNALINLAVLYGDREAYEKAEQCLQRVLEVQPDHPRARLYLKDVEQSRHMYYQEQPAPGQQHPLLEAPITNFNFTSRTQNSLMRMEVQTLGDLLQLTEDELKSFPNFGQSSVDEIRQMLEQRGLHLGEVGEMPQSAGHEAGQGQAGQPVDEQALDVLNQDVVELGLSARARKAIDLLNVRTIGDLVNYTEAELLGVKNFGVTSLEEIQQKLAEKGLRLRSLEE